MQDLLEEYVLHKHYRDVEFKKNKNNEKFITSF